MKNSPGSMIGGIGLTICVRGVHVARTISRIGSTWSSSAPTMIVAFDCLRKLPELCSRVARNSRSSRPSTSGARVLVMDDCDDELHRAEYARCDLRRSALRRGVRCALRSHAPPRSRSCPTSPNPLATPSRSLPRRRTHCADLGPRRPLAGLLQLAVDAAGATDAVVFLQDPDRPELQLAGPRGSPPTPPSASRPRSATQGIRSCRSASGAADLAAGLLPLVVETAAST